MKRDAVINWLREGGEPPGDPRFRRLKLFTTACLLRTSALLKDQGRRKIVTEAMWFENGKAMLTRLKRASAALDEYDPAKPDVRGEL